MSASATQGDPNKHIHTDKQTPLKTSTALCSAGW